jgi:hypothetical protein
MLSPSRKVSLSASVWRPLSYGIGADKPKPDRSIVYPADMPEKLPIPILAVRFSKDAVRTIIYCGWVIVVATAWLVVLPLIVKGVWGGLFSGGSSMYVL